jgi:hypothetical protein
MVRQAHHERDIKIMPVKNFLAGPCSLCWRQPGVAPKERRLVRLAGLEPATFGFEVRDSIQLSYRRILFVYF